MHVCIELKKETHTVSARKYSRPAEGKYPSLMCIMSTNLKGLVSMCGVIAV